MTADMSEPFRLSATGLAAAIRNREVSSREALESLLARIEAHNPAVNAVVRLDVERARAAAAAADEALASGAEPGPLHGVPVTIKDSLQTAGLVTTSGAPMLADFVPQTDADPVARYRRAGAVVFGKTNLPIWAGDVQSYNDVYGTTNNPYDLTRSPGGSSGGAAAALASGFTPLEIGSDIAGSIRNPSGMTGVVGHKPSYGICSARGQIPGMPGTLTQADLAVVGPMGRTVADVSLGLDLLAGPDSWQATAWSLELPPPRAVDPGDLRVAAWLDDDYCPVGSEIRSALEATAAALADSGARVDTEARPDFTLAKADDVFADLLGGALSGTWSLAQLDEFDRRRSAGEEPAQGDLGIGRAALRHRAWLSANERRLQMRARWREFFNHHDVVLMPVSPTTAIPHDHSEPLSARTITVDGEERPYTDQMVWMGVVGLAYLPSTVVPIGRDSNGLPIAVQVVGPYLEDRTALAAAAVIEQISGGFSPPPLD